MKKFLMVSVGLVVGTMMCGIVPALVVGAALGWALPNTKAQLEWNLPGADHGFGPVIIASWVLFLGGGLGAALGVWWGVRFGSSRKQDGQEPQQPIE